MTHFTRFTYIFVLYLSFCLMLVGCKSLKTSVASASQSATASETASRRTFYRTSDSLSRQFLLSADSISIIFNTEFPTAFPSQMEGCTETPSHPHRTPKSLKIYGLHLNNNIKEKSEDTADLKDSVNTFTQSQKHKSATKQKSAPSSSTHLYLYFIFIILLYCIIMYLKKRFQ